MITYPYPNYNDIILAWLINYISQKKLSNVITDPCPNIPDSKVHGANMGPIWGRQDPGGPHVGPINFAIWDRKNYVSNALRLSDTYMRQ